MPVGGPVLAKGAPKGPSGPSSGETAPSSFQSQMSKAEARVAEQKVAAREAQKAQQAAEGARMSDALRNPPLPPDTPVGVPPEARTIKAMLDRMDTAEPGARPFEKVLQNTQSGQETGVPVQPDAPRAVENLPAADEASGPSAEETTQAGSERVDEDASAAPTQPAKPASTETRPPVTVAASDETTDAPPSPEPLHQGEPISPTETPPQPATAPNMPPPSPDATPQQTPEEKLQQEKAAARDKYAHEQLASDSAFAEFLQKQGLDPQTIDIEETIKKYEAEERADKLSPEGTKILRRLREVQSLALRNEVTQELDSFTGDRGSDEYAALKKRLEGTDSAARSRYMRETLRKDNGLQTAIRNKWGKNVDMEDFDIDRAVEILRQNGEEKTALGIRLIELSGRGKENVLDERSKYITSQEESDNLMAERASAGSHDRNRFRRAFDGMGDLLAKIGGPEITDAWNKGKGYRESAKQLKKELKDSNMDPKVREMKLKSLENAKKLMMKSFGEAIVKRGGNLLLKFILIFSVLIIAAPLVGPAFVLDKFKGMGAKG